MLRRKLLQSTNHEFPCTTLHLSLFQQKKFLTAKKYRPFILILSSDMEALHFS